MLWHAAFGLLLFCVDLLVFGCINVFICLVDHPMSREIGVAIYIRLSNLVFSILFQMFLCGFLDLVLV